MSKLTKNSDFFARGERATLSHHFELSKLGYSQIKIDFTADSLLKDEVITVGAYLRLCLLSLWYSSVNFVTHFSLVT